MKSHFIREYHPVVATTYCGKIVKEAKLLRYRAAKKCKKCKRLMEKEWYVEG